MVRDYELMYIVRPELDDEALRATVKTVRGLLEAQGGQVIKTTLWGKRRLAYEVQRLRDGHYVLIVLRLDGAKVAPVERALRLQDAVFRHLMVLHEGPMPEADGEIEESSLVAPPADGESAGDVTTASAQTEEDAGEDGLEDAPTASDEGDE